MSTLSLTSPEIEGLIAQVRGLQARDVEPDVETKDTVVDVEDERTADDLEGSLDDLSPGELRESFRERVRDLDERQQDELVALLWLGRGDVDVEEWEDTVRMARERRDMPTEDYLLSQPLVAEHWGEGAAQLGLDVLPERAFGSIDG
jgi:Protein of unknown function (DUF3775)